MVVFGDILGGGAEGGGAAVPFYYLLDIAMCGLSIEEDGALRQNPFAIPQNSEGFLREMAGVAHKNAFGRRYMGRVGPQAFFLDECEKDVVFGAWEDHEDQGYYTYITARRGYLVRVDVRPDGKTAQVLGAPVRFRMLEWRCCSWTDHGDKEHIRAFPYFETLPVGEEARPEDIFGGILWGVSRGSRCAPRLVTGPEHGPVAVALGNLPVGLRAFYLRRHPRAWWAANLIATVWSRVYWDPRTRVGRRRLARRFAE